VHVQVYQYFKHQISNTSSRLHRRSMQIPPLHAQLAGNESSSEESRMLHERFALFMEVVTWGLRVAWGGSSTKQLVQRMNKMAAALSGGIELA
jgi:hypothetical protein